MSLRDSYSYRYGATFSRTVNNTTTEYHTFRDWSLLPVAPPSISAPEPKLYTVEIPGADGVLDLSESLTGQMQFGMRESEFQYMYYGNRSQWRQVYRELISIVHGQSCSIVLDEEPDMTYTGRMRIEQMELDGKLSKAVITITGQLYPWPTELVNTGEDWLWDPFNFEMGEATPIPTVDTAYGVRVIPADGTAQIDVTVTQEQAQGYPFVFEWTDGTAAGGIGVRSTGTTESFRKISTKNTKYTFDMYADEAKTYSFTFNGSYGMTSETCTVKIYIRTRQNEST